MIGISTDSVVTLALAMSALNAALDPTGKTTAIAADNEAAIKALVDGALARIVLELHPRLNEVRRDGDIVVVETAAEIPAGLEPTVRAALENAVLSCILASATPDGEESEKNERTAAACIDGLRCLLSPGAMPGLRQQTWL